MALLNYLKDYRSRMGINQTELGKLAGVSRQTISLIERGDYSPSVTLALRLAKIRTGMRKRIRRKIRERIRETILM